MTFKLLVLVSLILFFPQTPSVYLQTDNKIKTAVINQDCEKRISSIRRDFEGSLNACNNKLKSCACCDGKVKEYLERVAALQNKAQIDAKHIDSLNSQISNARSDESKIASLTTDNKRFKDLYESERAKNLNLGTLYGNSTREISELKKQNTSLLGMIDGLESRLGSESAKHADLFAQSQKIKSEREKLNAERTEVQPTEKPGTISICAEETYKALLDTDDITNKTSNDASVEIKTVTVDGKIYQMRELMIGTLLFPEKSALEAESKKPFEIKVIFRPKPLLKNSSADGKTNWFLEMNLASDKIKDFSYDEIRSKDKSKRIVGDEGDETWIWKIEKMPDDFSGDAPHIHIDGGVEIDGREIVKRTIGNEKLEITKKSIPSFLVAIFEGFVKYSTILLIFSTALFGFGTAYFGLNKAKIENKMKETEARNQELESQVTEVEKSGDST